MYPSITQGVLLTYCDQVCKTLHDLLRTNPHLALLSLLSLSSLRLNPAALLPRTDVSHRAPSAAELLARLKDRTDRMERFDPSRTTTVALKEREGTLYEYLEGVLIKSTTGGRDVAIYDIREMRGMSLEEEEEPAAGGSEVQDALDAHDEEEEEGEAGGAEDDWEEVQEGDEVAEKIRKTHKFGFPIAEFAVDPGQDLLVLVEVRWVHTCSL